MTLVRLLSLAIVLVLKPDGASAQSTTLRIWGDPAMRSILDAWESAFRRTHPQVRFANTLLGSDTAIPALYNHLADLAVMGREPNQTERDGFLHTLQYRPVMLELTMGSLSEPGHSFAPVVFVSSSNPLQSLTVAQLARALGAGQPGVKPATTWGDLGLTGPWATRPLHVYTYPEPSGTGLFLLDRLQGPSRKMNWDAVRELPTQAAPANPAEPKVDDLAQPGAPAAESARLTMAALADDPDGLAVSSLRFAHPGVRALPLALREGTAPVAANVWTITDATYPLARTTYAFADRAPGAGLPVELQQFLSFVFSPEGQQIVTKTGGFLPLAPAKAQAQLDSLGTR